MNINDIIQIISGFIGTICFGILFNIRSKRLAATALGCLLCCIIFVILNKIIESEPINYFIVAATISLYSEIMARILKTPATPIVTTSLIPLIPGSSLYYTMASSFTGSFEVFLEKAVNTLKLASALALGIIIVTAVSQFLFSRIITTGKPVVCSTPKRDTEV